MLINGNTRCAALRELHEPNIRVGVLPEDAGFKDLQGIELSLQLRRDHKRDYSFMNLLLAIDDREKAGLSLEQIARDFRMQPKTLDMNRWILATVREVIERSEATCDDGSTARLRLVDFESDQGKLEELYRAYNKLKPRSSDEAEKLKEARLLAIVLGRSKTDLRWIEADFNSAFMKRPLPDAQDEATETVKIPGTTIGVPGPSAEVASVAELTNQALRARALTAAESGGSSEQVAQASALMADLKSDMNKGLSKAGNTGRLLKQRLLPAERLSDANDALELAVGAIANARSTSNFDPQDLDQELVEMRRHLVQLAQLAGRDGSDDGTVPEGLTWLAHAVSPSPRED